MAPWRYQKSCVIFPNFLEIISSLIGIYSIGRILVNMKPDMDFFESKKEENPSKLQTNSLVSYNFSKIP